MKNSHSIFAKLALSSIGQQRSFWGSWVTLELDEALKQGYQVLEISEVWDYKNHVKYDGKSAESGLFTRYINSFLKLKVEASGWPSWVKTEEDREKFVTEYEEREGIRLDVANVEMNKTLRQVAKLCLNSFWGKFGQRDNLFKTKYFTDSAELLEFAQDPAIEATSLDILSDYMVHISYRMYCKVSTWKER